eukprot:1116147-Amphidinium_carterae.1
MPEHWAKGHGGGETNVQALLTFALPLAADEVLTPSRSVTSIVLQVLGQPIHCCQNFSDKHSLIAAPASVER